MELYEISTAGGSALSGLLKAENGLNELRARPRLGHPLRLAQSNDVCGSFFDDAEPIDFKLSNDCRLARTRRAGHNVSLHNFLEILLRRAGAETSSRRFAGPRLLNKDSALAMVRMQSLVV
jgi:hypothetical protein